MAQKNFSTMSSKKLNSLLETATDEDKALIQEVLNKRASVAAPAVEPEATEAAASKDITPEAKVVETKPNGITDEELAALAEELRATVVNHRCEVVPFNTIEWVPGTITGIIVEKRNNKIMYAVKTDDGRRIIKAYGSPLLRILDETVEPAKRVRSNKAKQLDENGNPIEATATPWTGEEIEEAVKEVIGNVGKTISYPKTGALGVEVDGETEFGRIVSLVPNKRTKSILYRILVDQPEGVTEKKYAHKAASNDKLVIAEELDEVGKEINDKFVERRYREVVEKPSITPEEAFKAAEASLNKAKEQLERQKALVEKREATYNAAKLAYENSLIANEIPAEGTDEAPEVASIEETEELA